MKHMAAIQNSLEEKYMKS